MDKPSRLTISQEWDRMTMKPFKTTKRATTTVTRPQKPVMNQMKIHPIATTTAKMKMLMTQTSKTMKTSKLWIGMH